MTATAAPSHAFKVEYMQPFVSSLKGLFEEHMGDSLTFGKMVVNETGKVDLDISGVITFSGTVIGRAVISFPMDVAESVSKAYLQMDPLPDKAYIDDCVGELANVVVGRAKSALDKHNIIISPPTVVRGEDFVIAPQRGAACIALPCKCSHGDLRLDISIVTAGEMSRKL